MKKVFFIIALVCVGALLWGGMRLLSRHEEEADAQEDIKTTKVELRDIRETITATGEVSPARKTPVKSEISGRIAKLQVKIGQTVEQGQVLVELDRSELLSQKEELLRAMEAATLRKEKAARDFERIQSLHQQDFITEKDYQDADTEARLAANTLEIETARLKTLEEKLARTTIQAPQSGVIILCDVEEGEVIVGANSMAQGTIIMEVADLSRLLVKADINEVDVVRLSAGAPVEITFDSVPGIMATGAVRAVSPAAKVDATKAVRVFPVEITCDAVDPRVRPGITANVTFPLNSVTQAPAAIVSAVFSDGTNKVAYLKVEDGFEQVAVAPGINDAQYVEIKEGLAAGDEIAVNRPAHIAKPGEEPAKRRFGVRRVVRPSRRPAR